MPPSDPSKVQKVVVHPLVLLSVVDHFNRMGKVGNLKRVVGVLLGEASRGVGKGLGRPRFAAPLVARRSVGVAY